MDDRRLIEAYTQDGSERAFAELTQRYEGLVFSAALRHVRDADLARDVVQKVFLCVARKATTLSAEPILAGWLGRAARLEALKLLRERRRRSEREQVFMEGMPQADQLMRQDLRAGAYGSGGGGLAASAAETEMEASVEAALRGLAEAERRVLQLRFQEGRALKDIAARLEISEDAAQKRVSRALDRLRATLGRNGVACSTAGLAAVLGGSALSPSAAMAAGVAAAVSGGAAVSAAGSSLFIKLAPLLAMAKIKVVAITCAVAAMTAVPLAVHFLRTDEPAPAESIADQGSPRPQAALVQSARPDFEPARSETGRMRAGVAEVEKAADARSSGPAAAQQPADAITALKQRAVNPRNDPRDRLAALGELRDRKGIDGQVVSAMIALAQTTTEASTRSDVFRQLHGTKDPALKPALLEAARQDASEEVRAEAAETLGDFSSDPAVQSALAEISRGDADAEVRGAAVEAVVAGASVEQLRRMQGDPQATDLELYHSTSALRKKEGAQPAQAAVLVSVLKSTGIPDLREEIVEDLGKHYGNLPEVVEWMQHLAANEQDPKVRREAAKFAK